ncbi:TIGR03667 family PPOX class F420-dependent oxidoreductase [Lipingzhangella sp. LS1_29]|uniref:TIGR03667 family PPOX class F420-dependent oxidoreductase n=1 Tax=Lipingzhangella rawalii TaxID=2055835 RepID=A0ABU2H4H0_9ACTN|nr:TIGR03667 family PPOX class F420-dependent oxidoreductase [Lipingzhangella rawalii]MDS1270209.1 TIGR03667 family PPOX class F420-dependent oxidoreductase [Lipingzhangella rawalii]
MTFEPGPLLQRNIALERVIWLVTVSPTGQPTSRPVWFVWDESAFLIHAPPESAKIRHLQVNPRSALHFNTDTDGEHVDVMFGRAEVWLDAPPPSECPGYLDKYAEDYPGIDHTVDSFDAAFSARLRIAPERSWGH